MVFANFGACRSFCLQEMDNISAVHFYSCIFPVLRRSVLFVSGQLFALLGDFMLFFFGLVVGARRGIQDAFGFCADFFWGP